MELSTLKCVCLCGVSWDWKRWRVWSATRRCFPWPKRRCSGSIEGKHERACWCVDAVCRFRIWCTRDKICRHNRDNDVYVRWMWTWHGIPDTARTRRPWANGPRAFYRDFPCTPKWTRVRASRPRRWSCCLSICTRRSRTPARCCPCDRTTCAWSACSWTSTRPSTCSRASVWPCFRPRSSWMIRSPQSPRPVRSCCSTRLLLSRQWSSMDLKSLDWPDWGLVVVVVVVGFVRCQSRCFPCRTSSARWLFRPHWGRNYRGKICFHLWFCRVPWHSWHWCSCYRPLRSASRWFCFAAESSIGFCNWRPIGRSRFWLVYSPDSTYELCRPFRRSIWRYCCPIRSLGTCTRTKLDGYGSMWWCLSTRVVRRLCSTSTDMYLTQLQCHPTFNTLIHS